MKDITMDGNVFYYDFYYFEWLLLLWILLLLNYKIYSQGFDAYYSTRCDGFPVHSSGILDIVLNLWPCQ